MLLPATFAGLALAAGPGGPHQPPPGSPLQEPDCPAADDEAAPSPAQRRAMRCLINDVRRRAGKRPLRVSPVLSGSAALKAQDVKRCGQLDHAACGKEPRAAADEAGYPEDAPWGENLYAAVEPRRAAEQALERWLDSREHRRVLLEPGWTEVGVGLLRDREGELERAIWVVHFGDRH